MTDIEFLQSTQIHKLQTAARMAGLRWKNGDPAYNKEGVIRELQFRPSVLLATVANIQAMDRGQSAPASRVDSSGLLDDIAAESGGPLPASVPQAAPIPAPGASVDLSAYVTRVSWSDGRQADDAQTRARIQNLSNETARGFEARDKSIESLKAKLIELEKRAPVQFVVDGKTLPVSTGRHQTFTRMAFWALQGNHILLVGPASSGKTTAAMQFAEDMSLELYSQPLSLSVFDVLGFVGPQGRVETEFSRAWINGGIFLWDELSMSAKEAIGALNAALANGFASFPGLGVIKKHDNFRMVAGDNSDIGGTLKYAARELLDGASLDRFIRIEWDIDSAVEDSLGASAPGWLACVRAIRAFIDARDIQHVGATMRATIAGCRAMQTPAFKAGQVPRAWILEDTCKRGALAAEWPAVLQLPAVRAFLQGA